MLKNIKSMREEGFTLVELLVVVIILVALAAIATPIFLNQKEKADAAVADTDAANIGQVLANGWAVADTGGAAPTYAAPTASYTSDAGDQSYTASTTPTVVVGTATTWCVTAAAPGTVEVGPGC